MSNNWNCKSYICNWNLNYRRLFSLHHFWNWSQLEFDILWCFFQEIVKTTPLCFTFRNYFTLLQYLLQRLVSPLSHLFFKYCQVRAFKSVYLIFYSNRLLLDDHWQRNSYKKTYNLTSHNVVTVELWKSEDVIELLPALKLLQ